jgi:glycosyltransferase involved in cell wall biosynthesis
MKIGILGTRGIPNNYGGFEKLAERLSVGLRERGHEVVVYNSHNHTFTGSEWNGVHIVHKFDPEFILGSAGQFIYDFHCMRDAKRRRFDVVLHLGYTSSSVWMPFIPEKAQVITNMDGFEWMRSKYSPLVRRFLRHAERLAVRRSDVLVSDSLFIRDYLSDKYGKAPAYIAYGADLFEEADATELSAFGLSPHGYNMLVARMEPENNIEMLLDGVVASSSQLPFLVVGQKSNGFAAHLMNKYRNEPRIRFMGSIYEARLINNLRYFSNLYFHGHSVGGTNPSLLEAMGCRALVIAHDNDFNKTVLGDNAHYFSSADEVARLLLSDRSTVEARSWIDRNYEKIATEYAWSKIIDDYERLMRRHTNQPEREPQPLVDAV